MKMKLDAFEWFLIAAMALAVVIAVLAVTISLCEIQ